MLHGTERLAIDSGIHLLSEPGEWFCCEDWPRIAPFKYKLAKREGDETLSILGNLDGCRVSHDWTIGDDVDLWDEADALDADVVRYVEALIREARACEKVFDSGPTMTHGQRITNRTSC